MSNSQQLAKELRQKYINSDSDYNYRLRNSQIDIIDCLGGLHSILQICLENNDVSQQYHINDRQFRDMKRLLSSKTNISRAHNHVDVIENMKPIDDKQRIIISASSDNNIYHILFGIKNIWTEWKVKVFISVMNILMLLVFLLSAFEIYFGLGTWIYLQIYLFVWCIHQLSLSNISIMKKTLKTFDFWFKQYQNVIILLSESIAYNSFLIGYPTLFSRIGFLLFQPTWMLTICFVDAWMVEMRIKIVLLFIMVLPHLFHIVYVYCIYPEISWDPFNGYFGDTISTNIQIKSLLLNALTTFSIFIWKPLIIALFSYCNPSHLRKRGIFQSTGLLRRPFIKFDCVLEHAEKSTAQIQYNKRRNTSESNVNVEIEAYQVDMVPKRVSNENSSSSSSTESI